MMLRFLAVLLLIAVASVSVVAASRPTPLPQDPILHINNMSWAEVLTPCDSGPILNDNRSVRFFITPQSHVVAIQATPIFENSTKFVQWTSVSFATHTNPLPMFTMVSAVSAHYIAVLTQDMESHVVWLYMFSAQTGVTVVNRTTALTNWTNMMMGSAFLTVVEGRAPATSWGPAAEEERSTLESFLYNTFLVLQYASGEVVVINVTTGNLTWSATANSLTSGYLSSATSIMPYVTEPTAATGMTASFAWIVQPVPNPAEVTMLAVVQVLPSLSWTVLPYVTITSSYITSAGELAVLLLQPFPTPTAPPPTSSFSSLHGMKKSASSSSTWYEDSSSSSSDHGMNPNIGLRHVALIQLIVTEEEPEPHSEPRVTVQFRWKANVSAREDFVPTFLTVSDTHVLLESKDSRDLGLILTSFTANNGTIVESRAVNSSLAFILGNLAAPVVVPANPCSGTSMQLLQPLSHIETLDDTSINILLSVSTANASLTAVSTDIPGPFASTWAGNVYRQTPSSSSADQQQSTRDCSITTVGTAVLVHAEGYVRVDPVTLTAQSVRMNLPNIQLLSVLSSPSNAEEGTQSLLWVQQGELFYTLLIQ